MELFNIVLNQRLVCVCVYTCVCTCVCICACLQLWLLLLVIIGQFQQSLSGVFTLFWASFSHFDLGLSYHADLNNQPVKAKISQSLSLQHCEKVVLQDLSLKHMGSKCQTQILMFQWQQLFQRSHYLALKCFLCLEKGNSWSIFWTPHPMPLCATLVGQILCLRFITIALASIWQWPGQDWRKELYIELYIQH